MKSEGKLNTRNYLQQFTRMGAIAALAALAASTTLAAQTNTQSARPSSPNSAMQQPAGPQQGPQQGQQTFPTAADASRALVAAIQKDDQAALFKVLGPNATEILSSGDDAEDKEDRDLFAQKYQEMHRLITEPDGTTTLYIGAENWPTPIPLIHQGNAWYFDTAAGKQEILYRRVGKNELNAIQACHDLVDAQKEYYALPHDGGDRQYAQKFSSDSGKQNGLYWESSDDNSPIGPLIAVAARDGYSQDADHKMQPYEGYYFRLLTSQGADTPGGAKNYIVDGKMTQGFAFVAYPAEYRSSGVMTFVVNQDGIVYEKDLGPQTADAVKDMTQYNPDSTWREAD